MGRKKYVVSVAAFNHYLVKANSAHEAAAKATNEAEDELPSGYEVNEVHPGGPLDD